MNRILLTTIALAALVFLVAPGRGQDGRTDDKDFAKLGAPGPEHRLLQKLVGTWELSMQGSTKKGSAQFKSMWDGRFVSEEATLPFEGFTMEWRGIYGYDKHKKKYTAVWVDNMDTNTESAEGGFDADGKILTLKGQHEAASSGQLETYIWRITVIDDANLKIAMLELDKAGKETGAMEILGRRSSTDATAK
jgi:Protein of unknown function (DUF1579)